ncbi:BrnT family toxin [Asticcacaulis benevestitus]|nr:BrnT family toxin [Asticcacaulis benevestitus]
MHFEWDEAKNTANVEKHGISFSQAIAIFDDVVVSRIDDRHEYGEERIISYGLLEAEVVVTVIHTDRSGVTRIISARLASSKERKAYYEAIR